MVGVLVSMMGLAFYLRETENLRKFQDWEMVADYSKKLKVDGFFLKSSIDDIPAGLCVLASLILMALAVQAISACCGVKDKRVSRQVVLDSRCFNQK